MVRSTQNLSGKCNILTYKCVYVYVCMSVCVREHARLTFLKYQIGGNMVESQVAPVVSPSTILHFLHLLPFRNT